MHLYSATAIESALQPKGDDLVSLSANVYRGLRWLFWYYVKMGSGLSVRNKVGFFIYIFFWPILLLHGFDKKSEWDWLGIASIIFMLSLVPFLIIVTYGGIFGHLHDLEEWEPVYVKPIPLLAIIVHIIIMCIALALMLGWLPPSPVPG